MTFVRDFPDYSHEFIGVLVSNFTRKPIAMPRNLNKEAIENLLGHQYLGRIGCHSKDSTFVVPVNYAYDGKAVYCLHNPALKTGLKIEVMRENPKVCFEVDVLENGANWQTVIAWGEYEEIREPDQREKALRLLFERKLPVVVPESMKLCEDWPFHPNNLNDIPGIVFRIKLKDKTGRYEMAE